MISVGNIPSFLSCYTFMSFKHTNAGLNYYNKAVSKTDFQLCRIKVVVLTDVVALN